MEIHKHHLNVPFYLTYLVVDKPEPEWMSPSVKDCFPDLPLKGCEDWRRHEEGVKDRRGYVKFLDDLASFIEFGTTQRWNMAIP